MKKGFQFIWNRFNVDKKRSGLVSSTGPEIEPKIYQLINFASFITIWFNCMYYTLLGRFHLFCSTYFNSVPFEKEDEATREKPLSSILHLMTESKNDYMLKQPRQKPTLQKKNEQRYTCTYVVRIKYMSFN